MGTIVQKYGPIYGETVNGTVQGRPNGSVFVPETNTITLNTTATAFFGYTNGRCVLKAAWSAVAQSQDLSNYIGVQIYSDSACTDLMGWAASSRGIFNIESTGYYCYLDLGESFTDEQTYYFRAQLLSVSNTPVATSSVIPLECDLQ